MTEQEDTRRKSRRDLLLVLLILPFGVLCMFMTGQVAIRLAPSWVLNADISSFLNPDAQFNAGGIPVYIEPIGPGILTLPAWGDLFLTPNAVIPTRLIPTQTPLPPRTPPPPPVPTTSEEEPTPTATLVGPIVLPTNPGPPVADLVIEKSDNSRTYTPGTAINYTIRVTNLGPDLAPRLNVIDNIPTVISGLTVSCTPADRCGSNTSSGNRISFTGANLPPGGTNQITISISGTVASSATGNLTNIAEIVIPSGVRYQDPDLSNNTATDTDTQLSVYNLAITKTDGVNTYTATNPIIYTIVVTNTNGPSDALGVRVRDNKPSQIASWTWTCTTVINAGRCNGVTNSSSNFTDTVDIRVGGRIEYTVTANLAALSQNPQNVSNTADILLPSGPGFVDPNMTNNSATDINIPYIDLQITKDDGGATYTPNGAVTYTVTVTNNSTFNLTGITVSDPIPARIASWGWCVAPCTPNPAAGNANFTDTINLAAGGSLVYTVGATVSGDTTLGDLSNTATVSAPAGLVDSNTANNSATDTTPPYIDLQITKTDGVDTYMPGGSLTYTVTVTNASAFDLSGVTVIDNIPALITSWEWICSSQNGGASGCDPAAVNSNNFTDTITLPGNGSSISYTVNAAVHPNAAGTLENTASVSPPAGLTDAVPGNNSATDQDTNVNGEPDIGPPDGDWISLPEGGALTLTFSPGIVADGDLGTPDLVYYETRRNATTVDLDWVKIEISTDGTTWIQVFYWGDSDPGIPDTNSNMDYVNLINDLCTYEMDNCSIPVARMYNSTGVTIDIDAVAGITYGAIYSWIRISAPVSPGGDGPSFDAIQPYYP